MSVNLLLVAAATFRQNTYQQNQMRASSCYDDLSVPEQPVCNSSCGENTMSMSLSLLGNSPLHLNSYVQTTDFLTSFKATHLALAS